MQTGETVFIPDATSDPSLKHVKGELLNRRVKSITVVPITWRGVAIGAIFLRTFRDGPTFSDRSEEHTSELQSLAYLVCRLMLSEKHTSELQSLAYLVCRLLLEKENYPRRIQMHDNPGDHHTTKQYVPQTSRRALERRKQTRGTV